MTEVAKVGRGRGRVGLEYSFLAADLVDSPELLLPLHT